MRYIWILGVAFILAEASGNPTPCQEQNTDQGKLQGHWVAIAAKTGDPGMDKLFLGRVFKFDRDTWQSFNKAGESEGIYTFKLDATKTPKQIDMTMTRKNRKFIILGIYSIEKDVLKLCWSGRNGNVRPKDFTEVGGDEQFRSYVLRRVKIKSP